MTCTCKSPETDWNREDPCGGVFTTSVVNGVPQPRKDPGCCEVHMKPWGHRRGCPTHDPRLSQAPVPEVRTQEEES